MDIFQWISVSGSHGLNSENFDYTYLLPVAAGLGSIALSFLIVRGHDFFCHKFTGHTTSLRQRSVKPNDSAKVKLKATEKLELPIPSNTSTQSVRPNNHKPQNQNDENIVKVESKSQKPKLESGNYVHNPKQSETDDKKSKKTKKARRSNKVKSGDAPLENEFTEFDPSWVLVTSKRTKHSTEVKSCNPLVNKSKLAKVDENATSSGKPSPAISGNVTLPRGESPTQENPQSNVNQKSSNSKSIHPVDSHMNFTPNPSTHTTSSKIRQVIQPVSHHTIPDGNSNHVSPVLIKQDVYRTESPKPDTGTNNEQSTVTLNASKSPANNLCNQHHQQRHLSSTSDLLMQQTLSQLKAQDTVCQMLRSEILNLREELKIAKGASKGSTVATQSSTPLCNNKRVDEGVMTDNIKQADDSLVNAQCKSPNNCDKQDNSDIVLVPVLQTEIQRLTKDIITYQQRSENFKLRLDASNKKLSDVKSKFTDQIKVLQFDLDNFDIRTRQMEQELQDTLQKAEMYRRKLDESEYNSSQRAEELERLRFEQANLRQTYEVMERKYALSLEELEAVKHDYDKLASSQSATLAEINNTLQQCTSLKHQLSERDDRLYELSLQRQSESSKTANEMCKFEMLLAENQSRNQADQVKISALESKLEETTRQIDDLKIKLEYYQSNASKLEEQKQTTMKPNFEDHSTQTVKQVDLQQNVVVDKIDNCCETDQLLNDRNKAPNDVAIDVINMIRIPSSVTEMKEVQTEELLEEKRRDTVVAQLESEVVHYKSALANTEVILSKLQNSVDEEETRWRLALDAVKVENELFKEKASKLEAVLSEMMRDCTDPLERTVELIHSSTNRNNTNLHDELSSFIDSIHLPQNHLTTDQLRQLFTQLVQQYEQQPEQKTGLGQSDSLYRAVKYCLQNLDKLLNPVTINMEFNNTLSDAGSEALDLSNSAAQEQGISDTVMDHTTCDDGTKKGEQIKDNLQLNGQYSVGTGFDDMPTSLSNGVTQQQ